MKDWGKWFVLGKKPYRVGPIVVRKGSKIIFVAAALVLAVPVAALAKGPIVRASESAWDAILRFFGL